MPPLGASGGSGDKKTQASVNKARTASAPKKRPGITPLVRVSRPVPRRSAPVIRNRSTNPPIRTPVRTPSGGPGKVEKVQKPLSLADWLKKDSEYQDQLRQFGKTWSDFLADVGVRKGRVGTEYGLGQKKMADQRVLDLQNLQNDYAGRGLLQSGLYADKVGQYEKDYQTNLADLTRNKDQLLQDISTEQQNFQREQDLAKEKARKSAAARRTASF